MFKYLKYLIIITFLTSILGFILFKHFLEAGIMIGGLSIVLLAEKNKKAREFVNKLF